MAEKSAPTDTPEEDSITVPFVHPYHCYCCALTSVCALGHSGLRLRNYRVRDPRLRKYEMAPAPVPGIAQEIERKLAALEAVPTDDVCSALPTLIPSFSFTLCTAQEPLNLVPKKRNWDLKRDMAPRLARLDRRTQAAVVELLRQRAQGAGSDDDEEEEDDEHEPKQEPRGSS